MDQYPKLEIKPLPKPVSWKNALGVGVVVMGLAMGTGELILWPHLVSKWGLGVLWLALVGITCQYFINQEVARHSLATGESFFTSSARVIKWFAFFWLGVAVVMYIWPGWASIVGTILVELFGFGSHLVWTWITLALVLLLTFSGRKAYDMLEGSLKITVPAFFLLLLVISFFNLSFAEIRAAAAGVVNFGYIPQGIDINVLLSAVVFAGAGGMMNLVISLWYRDKDAGMGKHIGCIENPITGKCEVVAATGNTFVPDRENLAHWRGWMRYVLIDQGVIFWFLGFLTLLMLSVNAHAVLSPKGIVPEGLQVAIAQAEIFGAQWGVFGYKLYLVMAFLMLFSVMWGIIDALTRIVSDIIYTNAHAGPLQKYFAKFKSIELHHLYYAVISVVVVVGAFLVPLKQPLTLLVISAVLGGLSMAVYSPVLIYINNFHLPKEIRPGLITNVAMVLISAFFIFFAVKTIINYIA